MCLYHTLSTFPFSVFRKSWSVYKTMQNKQHDLIKLITKVKVEKGNIWLEKILLHSIQFYEYLLKAFYVSSTCSATGIWR